MSKKPYLYGSLTVIVLMLVGWLVGQVLATSDNTYMRILLLQDVVNQVSLRYVDEIPQDQLYQRAVSGLLKNLDPYTELIPAEEFKRFQELQIKSEYLGTGISISRVDGDIVVMSTFTGSSAWRHGIQPGDRIIKVNGNSTKGWSTEQAKANLLGPEGSDVEITVSRIGVPEPIDLTLTRMPVVVPTVTRHFMLDKAVGYLRLSNFTERSAEELKKHLEKLEAQGMTSLILDLRDNVGGLTESAIDICDLFLSKKQLIVSMRGRNPEDSKSFFSTGQPVFKNQLLVVLINEFTASSSEIVAGAFQDHDRAVIVGVNSFGKGLVQTTFPLSSGDVLKITTARYYTPSGRNIQREIYRRQRLSSDDEEEEEPKEPEKYLTDMGREVKGGGGITPDVTVKADSAATDPLIAEIFSHTFDFAVAYRSMHPDLQRPFVAGPEIYRAFISYLEGKLVKLEKNKVEKHRDYITNYLLTYQIAQVTWDENTAYSFVANSDRQLVKALSIIKGGGTQSEIIERSIGEQSK
ncbi:MAG: S41 family peptidase [Candidatus Glassbacteria bacterium]|nr:S41 family peptidase [Candidatus Glassbacteria bacterium]